MVCTTIVCNCIIKTANKNGYKNVHCYLTNDYEIND